MELDIGARVSEWMGFDHEAELAERAKTDREAFAGLYRRHYRAIARYVYRRVGDVHTAEDLVADVFMAALRHLPQYRHRGLPVRAWFYRIATNRVNRWARRERRRVVRELTCEPPAPNGDAPSTLSAVARTRAILLTLTPKQQAVLALYYLEGMSVEDVAQTIGCRAGTVKSRLARGREKLRRRLESGRTES